MFGRYATATSGAALMTLALLYTMHALIDLQPGADGPDRIHGVLSPFRMLQEKPVVKDEFEQIRRDDLTKSPLPPLMPRTQHGDNSISVPRYAPERPRPDFSLRGQPMSDGPLVVLIHVAPTYPPIAEQRGLSGHVVVEFDITTAGRTTNVAVIESSHRVFEKAAIKAAERFKYRPQVVNGVPQPSQGIRTVLRFNMDET